MAAIDPRPILASTDLVALVGSVVKLRRHGRGWLGLCPFHGERTSSFHVSPKRFHCFGCGVHGDAIEWTRLTRAVGFRDACEYLLPGSTTQTVERYSDPMDDPVLRDLAYARTDVAYREYRDSWPWSALPREGG